MIADRLPAASLVDRGVHLLKYGKHLVARFSGFKKIVADQVSPSVTGLKQLGCRRREILWLRNPCWHKNVEIKN